MMARPKVFNFERPGFSEPEVPSSSESPSRTLGVVQNTLQTTTPYKYLNLAFLGRAGSGRNSLAWRMNNLNDSELPVLPFSARHVVNFETSTRPALRHKGLICLQIRIVPPEDSPQFFGKKGEISQCHLIVFIVDLGDERSSNDFYMWFKKVKKSTRRLPPFVIVGNKQDLRLFTTVTPRKWGESTASLYSAGAYLECSAKTNDRVAEVIETILKILL